MEDEVLISFLQNEFNNGEDKALAVRPDSPDNCLLVTFDTGERYLLTVERMADEDDRDDADAGADGELECGNCCRLLTNAEVAMSDDEGYLCMLCGLYDPT